ncbi:MAG: M56 family metallopeptidase [Acidobacteria bacterium]|nr:M56 family metallopeptidase [Acidobacteriota bacterium]
MATAALDLASQALAHTLVAMALVQAVTRRLPVTEPGPRFAYGLFILVAPLLLGPLFAVAAPFRLSPEFADVALLSSRRWDTLTLGGLGLRAILLVPIVAVALVLLLRDVLRLVRPWWREHQLLGHPLPDDHDEVRAVQARVARLAVALGIRPPRVDLIETDAAVLHCHGLVRPTIVVARGLLATLSPAQIEAALAHELAHLAHRDVLRTWILMALRVVHWFNPLAQVVARRAAQELEWRADDTAARVTGRPLALARALVTCMRTRDTQFLGLVGRSQIVTLEERCRRLLDPPPTAHRAWAVDFALVAITVAVVAFFVV